MTFGQRAETLLVHGGGLVQLPDGMGLNGCSEMRANRAVQSYYNGVVESLVFSGGNAHGDQLNASEATLMADIAIQAGVPHKRIEVEDSSSSTIGNWANSAPIIAELGESVLGMTGRLASLRARMIGKQLINIYNPGFRLEGYLTSGEPERMIAYPREVASSAIAAVCLHRAQAEKVELKDLNDFFAKMKSESGIATIKRRLTTY